MEDTVILHNIPIPPTIRDISAENMPDHGAGEDGKPFAYLALLGGFVSPRQPLCLSISISIILILIATPQPAQTQQARTNKDAMNAHLPPSPPLSSSH